MANNQGATAAKGSYLAFLNNDTKVDRQSLRPDQVHTSVNVLDICGSKTPAEASSGDLNLHSNRRRGKSYLLRKFFYHLRTGVAKSAFKVSSNYLKGR